jgi:hypothetical protein
VLPRKLGVSRDLADEGEHDRVLLALLQRHTLPQPWRLGYLDTGASDIVAGARDCIPVTFRHEHRDRRSGRIQVL